MCDNSSISNSNSMNIAMENSIISMDIIKNGRGGKAKKKGILMHPQTP